MTPVEKPKEIVSEAKMGRVRRAQCGILKSRLHARSLRGLMFLHLRRDYRKSVDPMGSMSIGAGARGGRP
jgi:hypothetical protein